jgi:HK97 family phage portal protein
MIVPRAAAMSVPAVKRARNIIAGTIATFELRLWQDGRPIAPGTEDVSAAFLRRPQRDRTLAWLLAWTVDDLLFHDVAYWRILERRAGGIVPAAVCRIEPHKITAQDDAYLVDGKRVRVEDVIAFAGTGVGGLCNGDAARAILTALALESAAYRYARNPQPQTVLQNNGAELDDAEQEQLLTQFEAGRQNHTTALINGVVDLKAIGWNARELQLVEARQHVALEVARMANLDAAYINAPTASSIDYTNRQDIRRDLVDVTLRPYLDTISQTLSVDNAHAGLGWQLATGGKDVILDPASFLRLTDLERAQVWQGMRAAGALTEEDVQGLEPLSPKGRTDHA